MKNKIHQMPRKILKIFIKLNALKIMFAYLSINFYTFLILKEILLRISEKNNENKYVVLSFDSSLKEINTFNYIISYIDERGYFVTNFYKYTIN